MNRAGRKERQSGLEIGREPPFLPPEAHLAEPAHVRAAGQFGQVASDAVLGQLLFILVNGAHPALGAQDGLDEKRLRGVQRLVVLGAHRVRAADLPGHQKLGAEAVQPGPLVGEAQVEAGALVLDFETDPQADVVRPQPFSTGVTRRMLRSRFDSRV
jgi:hypothetical protein